MTATTLTPVGVSSDSVVSFAIVPRTLHWILEARAEGGPRLICVEGSVTLVSPGPSHESAAHKLHELICILCYELGIPFRALGSTTMALPPGSGDTAYEPDNAYLIQNARRVPRPVIPDLAIEIVVTHPEQKALQAGSALGIPELWVLDVPHNRIVFWHLATRGKARGTYQQRPNSRAFPFLSSKEVLERLDDGGGDSLDFGLACRAWASEVRARDRMP